MCVYMPMYMCMWWVVQKINYGFIFHSTFGDTMSVKDLASAKYKNGPASKPKGFTCPFVGITARTTIMTHFYLDSRD